MEPGGYARAVVIWTVSLAVPWLPAAGRITPNAVSARSPAVLHRQSQGIIRGS
jgi:hypothetical protein